MNTRTLLTATILSVFFFGTMGMVTIASAQYMGNIGDTGEFEEIYLPPIRKAVPDNPSSELGVSYFDATGVVGVSIIIGAVFGGIAGTFFLRGRSGKYAAMGSG